MAAAAGKHSQLLPTPAERIVELNQRQRFVEFGLPQIDLGVVVARVAVKNLQVTSHAAAVAKTLARQDSVENWQKRQWPSPESFRQGGVFFVMPRFALAKYIGNIDPLSCGAKAMQQTEEDRFLR